MASLRGARPESTMPTTIAVLGAGAWGTAVALLLAQQSRHRVRLWCARADAATLLADRRENVRLLPGVPIPPAVDITADARAAVADADLCVTAVPTVYLRAALRPLAHVLPPTLPVVSLSKGIEVETFRRPTEIVRDVCGSHRLAVL